MASPQLRLTLNSFAVATLLSACAVAPSGKAPSSPSASPSTSVTAPFAAAIPAPLALTGTEWTAFAIDGEPERPKLLPKLRPVTADKVGPRVGRNGFTGSSMAVSPGSLVLGPLASTGRACLSMPGSQEDLFFKALELTRKARIERDQLVLMDQSGKQLARFVKTN